MLYRVRYGGEGVAGFHEGALEDFGQNSHSAVEEATPGLGGLSGARGEHVEIREREFW